MFKRVNKIMRKFVFKRVNKITRKCVFKRVNKITRKFVCKRVNGLCVLSYCFAHVDYALHSTCLLRSFYKRP